MFKPAKILVPTDFSQCEDHCSILAVKQAAGIAQQFGSKIVLLHVITEDVSKMPLFFLDDHKLEDLQGRLREHAEHELARIKDAFLSGPELNVTTKVRSGVAYDEILKEQAESDVDLITISSRGQSHLTDFFYGSTTEKVVRRATCSVLVVRRIIDR